MNIILDIFYVIIVLILFFFFTALAGMWLERINNTRKNREIERRGFMGRDR